MSDAKPNEAEKKPEAATDKAAARTNLLLMVLIGVMAIALIGGGAAMFIMYRGLNQSAGSAASNEAVEEDARSTPAKAKEPEKKKAAKKKEEGPKAPAIYVTLEPPFVVNFPAGKPAKFLQITMEIMTRDEGTAQLLKSNDPLLRNDVLMLFGHQDYDAVSVPEGREALRTQTLATVRGVVKKEGGNPAEVEAVYFTSLVMQ